MTNKYRSGVLVRCFADVLLYVSQLHNLDAKVEFNAILVELDEKFRASVKASLSRCNDIRDYDVARFAVCAWIDEHLMSIEWVFKNQWRDNLLQSHYYHTTNAGSEFFERLSKLDVNNNVVREVYLMCLGMGFRGKYATYVDFNKISSLRDEAVNSLGIADVLDGKRALFDEAYPSGHDRNSLFISENIRVQKAVKRNYLIWFLGLLTLFFVYTAYSSVLDKIYAGVSLTGGLL